MRIFLTSGLCAALSTSATVALAASASPGWAPPKADAAGDSARVVIRSIANDTGRFNWTVTVAPPAGTAFTPPTTPATPPGVPIPYPNLPAVQ
jgi:hypothetical protein